MKRQQRHLQRAAVTAVIHFNVTPNPTQAWLARQITEAFPWDTAPRFLLQAATLLWADLPKSRSIEEVVSQWQNAYVERVIGLIRGERLDHSIVFN